MDNVIAHYKHYRVCHRPGSRKRIWATKRQAREQGLIITGKGGETVCGLFRDGRLIAQGIARCRTDEQFDPAMGRAIAEGRARATLERLEGPVGLQGLVQAIETAGPVVVFELSDGRVAHISGIETLLRLFGL